MREWRGLSLSGQFSSQVIASSTKVKEDYELPYAGGIPGEWREIFIPLLIDRPIIRSNFI
jgi:hypothetical protein